MFFEQNKKPRRRKNLLNKLFFNQISFFLIGLGILVLLGFPLYKNITRQYHASNEIKGLQKEIAGIESKQLKLNNLIEYLNSDEFVQKQARLNLNFMKPGEEVVVVSGADAAAAGPAAGPDEKLFTIPGLSRADPPKKESNPEKWRDYFFKSAN